MKNKKFFTFDNRFGVVILASLGIASNKFREVLKLRLVGDSGDKADEEYINFAMKPDEGQLFFRSHRIESIKLGLLGM